MEIEDIIKVLKERFILIEKPINWEKDYSKARESIYLSMVLEIVCKYFSVDLEPIMNSKKSANKDYSYADIRAFYYKLSKENCPIYISYETIAKVVGKDHCAFIYGIRQINNKFELEPDKLIDYENLNKQIKSALNISVSASASKA
mgnify:CR=1 FL=1